MKLEQQVISLESAKRLKELGVKQNSLFSWIETCDFDAGWNILMVHAPVTGYSAFTSAELGNMLPTLGINWVKSNNGKGHNYWWGKTAYPTLGKDQVYVSDHKEAEARAKMLIRLLENKIVTVEDISK